MNKKARASHHLLVVGTVAIDSVKTPFGEREMSFGGSASYFSYAASFFTKVALMGVVGKDFPDEYRAILEERSIDLTHLECRAGKTFYWKGNYESDLNSAQTLDTQLNVLTEFDPHVKFETVPPYLFLANIDPTLQLQVLDQIESPKMKFVAADTMNFWISGKREELLKVLKRVDGIVLNDGETRQLTGEPNLVKAAKTIRGYGPGTVIIKKGEHGVLVFHENSFFALPAYPLEAVFDPTGAGDSFAGGFMGYLASQNDVNFSSIKKAVAYGTVVASFTVEDFSLDSLRKIERVAIEERLGIFKAVSHF